MQAPMPPERLAVIAAHARQPLYLALAEERPESAVAHRLELLGEVERLRGELDHATALLESIPFFRSDEEQDALCAQAEEALANGVDQQRCEAMRWRDAE